METEIELDIESERLENLKQKQKLLAELNLQSNFSKSKLKAEVNGRDDNRPQKRRKVDINIPKAEPTRISARIRDGGRVVNYNEVKNEKYNFVQGKRTIRNTNQRNQSKAQKNKLESEDVEENYVAVIPATTVADIVAGWTGWTVTNTGPSRDEDGKFHFDDYPDFTPNKSPEEMIREGSFGGSYWRPLRSRRLGGDLIIKGDWEELPSEWTRGLDVKRYLTNPAYDADVNKFKVACGQSIEEWEAAGWIRHEFDIRGWFQWYCRFWMGRRCDDDDRQVSRWKKCVGDRGRWRRLLLKKYVQLGVRDVTGHDYEEDGDEEGTGVDVSPVMHQTCHHWGFEVRQSDLDEAWKEFG